MPSVGRILQIVLMFHMEHFRFWRCAGGAAEGSGTREVAECGWVVLEGGTARYGTLSQVFASSLGICAGEPLG